MVDLAEQRDLETVYQPAEDSHLLATTAAAHVDDGDLALDVGTGSGYVADALADAGARVVASDLNPHACRQARAEGLEVVRGNLLDPFAADTFDVVTFNPPYLPTDPENEWDDWMEHALSGGESGRAIVAPFLEDVSRVLTPDGAAYVLISTLTGTEAVAELAAEAGLTTDRVAEESYPFEKLLVLQLITDRNNFV
jgi:release factor glutamine methyltransferase